jgi:hypothetical protein
LLNPPASHARFLYPSSWSILTAINDLLETQQ